MKGLDVLRWIVERNPRRERYSLILGDACERLGRHEDALAAWRTAAEGGSGKAVQRLAKAKQR